MSFQLDISQIQKAFEEIKRATKKDGKDILNRAGRNVCLRAIKDTPRADAAKIRALDPRIFIAAVVKDLAGRKVSRAEFNDLVKKKRAGRARSVGYIKAGWANAAKAFGAKGGKVSSKGLAAEGYGKLATENKLVAVLANHARGASQVGSDALQGAINFVAKDMAAYAKRALAKTFAKHSGKKQ